MRSANSDLQSTVRKTLLKNMSLSRHLYEAIPLRSAEWLWVEKDNRIATHYCRTHRCDAEFPTHSVPQHMQTTIDLQRATVEHIALMQQFQWNSHLGASVTLRAKFVTDSTAKRRRLTPSRSRANISSQRNIRLPEKTMFRANPNIQIVWTSCSNAICQKSLAKHNQDRKT